MKKVILTLCVVTVACAAASAQTYRTEDRKANALWVAVEGQKGNTALAKRLEKLIANATVKAQQEATQQASAQQFQTPAQQVQGKQQQAQDTTRKADASKKNAQEGAKKETAQKESAPVQKKKETAKQDWKQDPIITSFWANWYRIK